MAWSPDGKYLAATARDGFHLFSLEKGPIPAEVPDAQSLVWLNDSSLILMRAVPISADQFLARFSTDERQALLAAVQRLQTDITAYKGESNRFLDKHPNWRQDKYLEDAFAYLLVHDTAFIKAKMGADFAEVFRDFCPVDFTLQHYKLAGDNFEAGSVLRKSKDLPAALRLSPDGKKLLISEKKEGQKEYRLVALDISDQPASVSAQTPSEYMVVEKGGHFADWSGDSRSAFFVTESAPNHLGQLVKQEFCDAYGKFSSSPCLSTPLAFLINDGQLRLQSAANNLIVFRTSENTLPTGEKDISTAATLFKVPADQPTVSRVIPRSLADELGDVSERFAISPDGKMLVADTRKGGLQIVRVADGTASSIHSADWTATGIVGPQWRSGDEVCAAVAQSGKGRKIELVLWSCKDEKGRIISKSWPEATLKWLQVWN